MSKRSAGAPDDLGSQPNSDEIFERLGRLLSPTLLDVLYSIAKDQIAAEEKRETLLVGKANALLGVTGLSLTVTFTFGGLLLRQQTRVSWWVVALYFGALATALGAALCAVGAMWIQESRAVGAKDVFNEDALASAEAADLPAATRSWQAERQQSVPTPLAVLLASMRPFEGIQSTEIGTAAYKGYLVSHYWQIYDFNSTRHERTAKWVGAGQKLYGAFLLTILLTGVFLATGMKLQSRADHTADRSSYVADAGVDAGPGSTGPLSVADAGVGNAGFGDGGIVRADAGSQISKDAGP